jgi:malate dehydrogenase (quinone)
MARKHTSKVSQYDVAIIGAGATGTATLYVLSRYTDVKRIAVIEKYSAPAQVNTRKDANSQTLHFGDIETNYTAEKAKNVSAASSMTARYLDAHADEKIFKKSHKMVIAVGKKEVHELAKRYDEIKHIFPKLKKIGAKELAKLEPNVMKGRDPKEEILALYSPDGYVVDFGKISQSFISNAKTPGKTIDLHFSEKILSITKDGEYYVVAGNDLELRARTVVVAAGADSLLFAHKLG